MVNVASKISQISTDSPADISVWLKDIDARNIYSNIDRIRLAAELSQRAHQGQTRISGEPYFLHTLAVANILVELNMDTDTICAAILHDVVEDTDITLDEIQQQFGDDVAHLVDGVTKMDFISTLGGRDRQQQKEHMQSENLRKMLLAMAEDVRVVLIKLADRLHNMRTLSALRPDKQRRIARETMDIFAPLANRLGIWQLKWELEDLAFRYINPEDYKHIAHQLVERRVERELYIDRFVLLLRQELEKSAINAEVHGRPKHIYGIWKKMHRKHQAFEQIYDVRAVRIYVESIPDCYAALGIVHTQWQYLPGEFDDYIATPKENNYRSIHTAVFGPEGKTIEVQIRTNDMHQESEYGIAAHWRYKEGAKTDTDFDEKIAWLRQLLEWKNDVAEANEFVDQFKSEVFTDRVYVFTPQGNIIDLPAGATPLDFAYQIHTEVGHHCRGVRINGHMEPLTYTLRTGDQVQILTVKKGGPSRDWMNPHLGYLVTNKARHRVQHWYRVQNAEQNIADGRAIVDRELKRLGINDVSFEKLASHLQQNTVESFLAAIGRGDIKSGKLATTIQQLTQTLDSEKITQPVVHQAKAKTSSTDIKVYGVGDLLTKLSRCCKPLPGDPIVGYITKGSGVSIHRRDCHNVLHSISEQPERFVEVDWGSETDGSYSVDIQVQAYDRQGLLRDITTLLSNEHINVTAVTSESHTKTHTVSILITVEIPNFDTLSRVIAKIARLPNVTEVRRKSK
jgi:GTP pyrophosphokinase